MLDSTFLIQTLISGLGTGCIYGLIGIGFCVIYNASGIVNFAQGVFVMLGGMVARIAVAATHAGAIQFALVAGPHLFGGPLVAGFGCVVHRFACIWTYVNLQ